ncbi:hypothetical protein ES703_79274 [subsurface metagenome]
MATKWAFPRLEKFDDVASILSESTASYELLDVYSARSPITCEFILSYYPSEATAQDFFVKVQHADNWQLITTFNQQACSLAGYYSLLYPEHITNIEPAAKSAFEEGKEFFEKYKESLIRRFDGKYIAIWENDVMDWDTSFSSLAQRVYRKLGYVSIYMPFVSSKPQVVRFESPRYR